VAQAVSRWHPTAEARVRSRVSPCGICGGQSGTGTAFSPSSSFLPCQYHSTGAPLRGKGQKIIIIFIIWLHKKPHGCSASVASAAGPFITKRKKRKVFLLSLCSDYMDWYNLFGIQTQSNSVITSRKGLNILCRYKRVLL
jgi:hypothetical protein